MSFPKYPKYKDSGVEWLGDVPDHWEMLRLKFLSDIQTGDKDTVDAEDEGEYPFFVRSQTVERISTFTFDCEAILTAGDGVGVGKVFHYHRGPFDFHQRVYMMNHFHGIDGRFLFHYLRENFYKVALEGGAKSTVDSIRRPMLTDFPVVVPTVEEQSRIVTLVDAETSKIDALIAEQRRLIELLKEKRQAVISHAVTKGLNPDAPMKASGIEWLGDVPEHWSVFPLHRIVQQRRPITYGIVQPGEPDESGRFMIRNQDFTSGWANPDSLFRVSNSIEEPYQRARMKPNDLIMTIVGAVGSVGIIPAWLDGANTTQNLARIAIDETKASPFYVAALLQGPVGSRNVEFYSKGSVQAALNLGHVRRFWVTVPPLNEQTQIVEHINGHTAGLDALTAEATRAIDLLQERRTALISAAVTGKIDVREFANVEAA